VFLFHRDLDLFARTLPRCLEALVTGTDESFETTIYCDGTPREVLTALLPLAERWGIDQVTSRRRGVRVAAGAPGNNAHRRLFPTRSRYLLVIEDDVTMYRCADTFDPLRAIRNVFESDPRSVVLSKLDDHSKWAWPLLDVEPHETPGLRIVNRLATHFIAYDTERFLPPATRFGAWWSDVFIDRDDWSYNWEDLVSHVGTTGGRRIIVPQTWPLRAYHCDEKIAPDSMFNTQDPAVKMRVFEEIDSTFGPPHSLAAP